MRGSYELVLMAMRTLIPLKIVHAFVTRFNFSKNKWGEGTPKALTPLLPFAFSDALHDLEKCLSGQAASFAAWLLL